MIAKWGNDDHSAVHCLSVLADQELVDTEPEAEAHPHEVETDGNILFAGLDNGETLGIDIRARYAMMNLPGRAAILSCASTTKPSGGSLLFTGSEDGLLTSWDLRNTRYAARRLFPVNYPHLVADLDCMRGYLVLHSILCLAAARPFIALSPRMMNARASGLRMETEVAVTGTFHQAPSQSFRPSSLAQSTTLYVVSQSLHELDEYSR